MAPVLALSARLKVASFFRPRLGGNVPTSLIRECIVGYSCRFQRRQGLRIAYSSISCYLALQFLVLVSSAFAPTQMIDECVPFCGQASRPMHHYDRVSTFVNGKRRHHTTYKSDSLMSSTVSQESKPCSMKASRYWARPISSSTSSSAVIQRGVSGQHVQL